MIIYFYLCINTFALLLLCHFKNLNDTNDEDENSENKDVNEMLDFIKDLKEKDEKAFQWLIDFTESLALNPNKLLLFYILLSITPILNVFCSIRCIITLLKK